jgi:F420-0:gamma-glutamyl ligase
MEKGLILLCDEVLEATVSMVADTCDDACCTLLGGCNNEGTPVFVVVVMVGDTTGFACVGSICTAGGLPPIADTAV